MNVKHQQFHCFAVIENEETNKTKPAKKRVRYYGFSFKL